MGELKIKKTIKVLIAVFLALAVIPFATMALVAENADVSVVLKDYDPLPAEPDSNLRVWISVQNQGNEQADNVYVQVNPSYPFVLLPGEDDIKETGIIGTNSDKILDYRLFVNKGTKAGDYDLTFWTCSDNECNKVIKKTDLTITVKTGGEPKVNLGIEEIEEVAFNQKSKLTINIVNKGELDTKYLTVTLDETEDFIVISPQEVYVGELESDDFETATFDIYFKSEERKPETTIIEVPILVEYTDANNKEYADKQILDIRVYSQEDLYKYGLATKPTPFGAYVVIAGLLVAIFFIYRRIKKKRKLKSQQT